MIKPNDHAGDRVSNQKTNSAGVAALHCGQLIFYIAQEDLYFVLPIELR